MRRKNYTHIVYITKELGNSIPLPVNSNLVKNFRLMCNIFQFKIYAAFEIKIKEIKPNSQNKDYIP